MIQKLKEDSIVECHLCHNDFPESEFAPYMLKRTKSHHVCRKCNNERLKRYQASHRDIIHELNKKYEHENREKRNAKREVLRALESGRLEKHPCVVCGSMNSEAHHYSYAEIDWLNVVWVCSLHHKDIHHGRIDVKTLPVTHGELTARRRNKILKKSFEGKSLREIYDITTNGVL